MKASRLALFLCCSGFCLSSFCGLGKANANPRHSGLVGARSSALAGAVSADASDCTAVYYNPALLAGLRRDHICLDYALTHRNRSSSQVSSADTTQQDVAAGLAASGSLAGLPFGVGALFVLPDGQLSRLSSVSPRDEVWVLEQNRPHVAFAALGVSLFPLPFLGVGAALNTLTALSGGFIVSGSAVQPDLTGRTEFESQLTHSLDATLDAVHRVSLGALLQTSERLSLALVYRQAARLEQNMTGQLDGVVHLGPLEIPAEYAVVSRSTPADYPQILSLGLSWMPAPSVQILAELSWENFARWQSPEGHTESELFLDLPPGIILDVPEPAAAPSVDAKPRDRLVPRVGIEGQLFDVDETSLFARGGYAFLRSPLPAQTSSRWLDTDQHRLSTGLGLQHGWRGTRLSFDLGASVALLPERLAVSGDEPSRAWGHNLSFGLSTALAY